MTVSMTDFKSRNGNGTAVSDEVVCATVTGVDVKGNMFRRPATILAMDGRDCTLRFDRQPESGGSILIEFDNPQADPKHHVLHASVKSSAADSGTGFYATIVELEVANSVKILLKPIQVQIARLQSNPSHASSGATQSATGNGNPVTTPRDIRSRPASNGNPHVLPAPSQGAGIKADGEIRESLPKARAENPLAVREAVKSAVASEIKHELTLLKNWISGELEKTLPGIVSSNMEKMIREAVDRQTSAINESTAQALNRNVAHLVEDRIAVLRISLEDTARKLVQDQIEVSHPAADQVVQELSSHAASIMRSFEESAAEMAKKLSDEQTELSRKAGDHVEQELSSHAAAIMRSFEESTAEMAKKLVDEQTEISRTAGDRVEQELSSRASRIMRSFEESTTEMARKLFEEQAALSRTAGENAEQELNSRASTIMRSFEESTAEMANKLANEQMELSRSAGGRVEQELNSRASTIIQSFEESASEMASKLFEEKAAVSRTAADNAERELNSRAAAIMRFVEESTVEMEARINASRAVTEEVVARSHSLQQEINDGMIPLQQALRQLHDANKEGIQNLQSQAISEINRRAAQFENELDKISGERAIAFAAEIESRLAPGQQQADELLEKLGAVFQLLQSTGRVQQERLAEQSRAAGANFEKEIKSIFLRLAGGD